MLEQVGFPAGGINRFYLNKRGFLIHEKGYESKFLGLQRRRYSPSEEQWKHFYNRMQVLEVSKWKPVYHPSDHDQKVFIDDGFIWSFSLSSSRLTIITRGDNAIPSHHDPARTVYSYAEVYARDFGRLGELFRVLHRLTAEPHKTEQGAAANP